MQTTPLNDPPLSREVLEKAIKNYCLSEAHSPEEKATAFKFISDFLPSQRDDNWKRLVENFFSNDGKPRVKIIEPQNRPPINGLRSRQGHRF